MLSGLINFIKEKLAPQPKTVNVVIEEPVKVECKVEERIEPVLEPITAPVVVQPVKTVDKTSRVKKQKASRK